MLNKSVFLFVSTLPLLDSFLEMIVQKHPFRSFLSQGRDIQMFGMLSLVAGTLVSMWVAAYPHCIVTSNIRTVSEDGWEEDLSTFVEGLVIRDHLEP